MTRQHVVKKVRQRLKTAKRRTLVVSLVLTGATYRDVATAVEAELTKEGLALPKGWDERYAFKDAERELDRLRKDISASTEMLYQLTLARYNRLLMAVWPAASRGQVGAVDRAVALVDRIAKLAGVTPPENIVVDVYANAGAMTDEEKADRLAQYVMGALDRKAKAEGAKPDIITLPPGAVQVIEQETIVIQEHADTDNSS